MLRRHMHWHGADIMVTEEAFGYISFLVTLTFLCGLEI